MKHIVFLIFLVFFAQISFSQEIGSFKDPRDGNIYGIVRISGQVWMSENLNFQMPGATCYGYSKSNGDSLGRLYTWDAAVEACPEGWHLPTDDEWKIMEKNLGMNEILLDRSSFRNAPKMYNAAITNGSSGLNLEKSGWRGANGKFYHLNKRGVYWTASINRQNEGWFRFIDEHKAVYRRYERKNFSYSVRCISNSNHEQTFTNNDKEINDNDTELLDNGKYALNSIAELEELLKKAIREEEYFEAAIIKKEIDNRN
ncbi:MAG: FISUMP domain-containing protein [Bacteroidota bacterium]